MICTGGFENGLRVCVGAFSLTDGPELIRHFRTEDAAGAQQRRSIGDDDGRSSIHGRETIDQHRSCFIEQQQPVPPAGAAAGPFLWVEQYVDDDVWRVVMTTCVLCIF